MPSNTIDHDAVRTRAYLMWEADGRPFGRDDHYWGIALAEATAVPAKPKRAAAAAKPAEKKAKVAAKPVKAVAKKPVAAKPAAKPKKK